MKRLNLFIYFNAFFVLFGLTSLNGAPHCYHCKKEARLSVKNPLLKEAVCKLRQLPESNRVIEEALEGGSITAEITCEGMPFNAMWMSGPRKVFIDGRANKDQGKLLRHLLFELTNAVAEPKYQELAWIAQDGRIDCDSYVEAVEKIEHENMVNVTNIIERGVAAGIFPSSARWEMIYDFDVHYKIQQLLGHSLHIANEYQSIRRQRSSSYRGTVKNLKRMSQKEKMSMAGFLYSNYYG